jgi:glycosyltransferase involved in cell wall biosynthesis
VSDQSESGLQASPAPIASSLPPVLFMADHFGYPSGVSHGLTTYFLHILPALVKAGVDLTACFLREPHPAAEQLRDSGIEPVFLSTGKLDVLVPFRIAALAKERGCRILHASQMKATLAARISAPLVGARTIVHVHDLKPTGPLVGGLHWLFSRRSDIGLCVADAVQDMAISDYYVSRDRVRTLHNSVRLEHFRNVPAAIREQIRAELNIESGTPVLGFIGRMYPVKGHRAMLRMMGAILKRRPDVLLLLIGDGPERAACERLVKEQGIERNVRFLGQRSDIPELLAVSDLLVMPSESEGLPLTAIEAIAAGRPVVGFDVGGFREIVDDGQSGSVIPPGDNEAFTQAILSLLESPKVLAAYGACAFAAAERFGVEYHVKGLLQCYRDLHQSDPRAVLASALVDR